jgi:L-ribulose-5-phosphate 3-epimerase
MNSDATGSQLAPEAPAERSADGAHALRRAAVVPRVTRRAFVRTAATTLAATAAAGCGTSSGLAQTAPATPAGFKKAVKIGMVQIEGNLTDKFRLVRELGFDGIELDSPGLDRDAALRAQDATGLTIHGLVDSAHWRDTLSHPDPQVRQRGVEALRTALQDAQALGATTVLLVPAVVNKDVSYEDAYRRSQAEIRKVLPLAEELGVRIGLENVWNNFLLSPLETARYIDEFASPAIGAYFDVGNVVRYGWPQHWVRTLGRRILKLDIKEYSRKKQIDEGLWKGFQVELLEGDCDWPEVMRALREVGFRGWGTAEVPGGGRQRLAELAARMDKIFALYEAGA